MPCDSVILNRVDLGKLDLSILPAALQEMGAVNIYTGIYESGFQLNGSWYQIQSGKLVFDQGAENIADKVKRSVAVAGLKRDCAKKGWQVKKVGESKFQVIKR